MKKAGKSRAVAGPTTETPAGQLGGSSKKSVTKLNNMTSTGSTLTPATGPGSGVTPKRGRKKS